MKRCNELGIRLITIFEDEWINRQNQVKQFLKSVIGVFDMRIFARKCLFQQIEPNSIFFDNNHIQGYPQRLDSVFGLFHENTMIGCVSYAGHHRNNNDLTLNRLAFIDGVQCVGGASKLIKNSLTIVNENVITWSDSRWTEGFLYEKCGFKFDGLLPADYSYVTKKKRISKQAMQKSKIGCPENMTEHQFCLENKIYRIYDCGKKRWKFNKEL